MYSAWLKLLDCITKVNIYTYIVITNSSDIAIDNRITYAFTHVQLYKCKYIIF